MTTTRVAVPRKGRPLEAVLERLASRIGTTELADEIISTLRYEKDLTKGNQTADGDVYHRLVDYSDLGDPTRPEFTLLRDDRDGTPRRIVFDSVTIPTDCGDVQLIGREEPFRALRTHEFALGFDSADLVLEEVVELQDDPLRTIAGINDRIDPLDTDVRVATGLGDTVYHTLLRTPAVVDSQTGPLDREFVRNYAGPLPHRYRLDRQRPRPRTGRTAVPERDSPAGEPLRTHSGDGARRGAVRRTRGNSAPVPPSTPQ
jgi:hypothetical protein